MDESLARERGRLFQAGSLFLLVLSLVGIIYFFSVLKEYRYIGRGEERSQITVSGTWEELAKPDIATINYTALEEAKTAEEAQRVTTQKGNIMKTFLKESGIEDKDVKTTSYRINPKYEWRETTARICPAGSYCPPSPGRQVLVGYEASETVEVKIRNLDQAGEILAGIGSRGVSNVSGLNFTIDDIEAVKAKARDIAIKDAQEKAKKLAKSLDVNLIRVVNFSEEGNYPQPYYAKLEMQAADGAGNGAPAPNVSPGENTITSNVTITYEIR